MVGTIHSYGLSNGLCFNDSTSGVSCLCHPKERVKLPSVQLSRTDQQTVILRPQDYLGAPYLSDYQVLCRSNLASAAPGNEDIV